LNGTLLESVLWHRPDFLLNLGDLQTVHLLCG
jgi:hypothetical protein